MSKKFWLALAVCVGAAVLSLCLGAVALTPLQLWQALIHGPKNVEGYILWYARLPRTAACLLAGSALASSGCILQRMLGSDLASPGIIGVNAGAGLGVAVCCALGALSGWAFSLAAFAGAVVAVLAVAVLAWRGGTARSAVILAGVATGSILSALRDALTTLVSDAVMLTGEFRVGGFSAVVGARLTPAAVLIIGALLVALTLCRQLDVLSLGEETARSLGMSVRTVRSVFLLLAAILAGAAVSFAGLLGFVGLLVPHMARRLVGSESRRVLPMSILLGAALVTACDLVSRLLFAPHELPVGILLSVLGGPFFLVLLLKKGGPHA